MVRRDHGLQSVVHHVHVGVFQRKDAQRHAREVVDIKRVNHLQPPFQLNFAALQHQQVAQRIHVDNGLTRCQRTENLRHLARTNVVQGDDHRTCAGQILDLGSRRQRAAAGRHGPLGDVVDTRGVADDRQIVRQQHGIQHIQHLLARQRFAGAQADHGVPARVDRVADLEQVAQQGRGQTGDRDVLKIQRDTLTLRKHRIRLGRKPRPNQLIVAGKDTRARRRGGVGALRLGRHRRRPLAQWQLVDHRLRR